MDSMGYPFQTKTGLERYLETLWKVGQTGWSLYPTDCSIYGV